MRQYTTYLILLMLISCGQPDQQSGGQPCPIVQRFEEVNVGIGTTAPSPARSAPLTSPPAMQVCSSNAGFVEVDSGMAPVTPEPLHTFQKIGNVLEVDLFIDRFEQSLNITMDDEIHFIVSQPTFAKEKYYFLFNPDDWIKLIDGREVPYEEATERYPANGWVFKPKHSGYLLLQAAVYEDEPTACEKCATSNVRPKSYAVQIMDAAK